MRGVARGAGGGGRGAGGRERDRVALRGPRGRHDDGRRHRRSDRPDLRRPDPAEAEAHVRRDRRRTRTPDLHAGRPRATVQGAGEAMTIDPAPILAGDVRTSARLMRDLDDRRPDALAALKALYAHTGRAYVVGITGNPGAGKSTVVDALIAHYRAAGEKV